MSYSQFTLEGVVKQFSLRLADRQRLFDGVRPAEPGPLLREWLDRHLGLGLAVATESARFSVITIPMLLELRRLTGDRISVFPGVAFDVAAEQGLNGECDAIISGTPEQRILGVPVVALVEAKKNDIAIGLGQCAAEMVAARMFNERAGVPLPAVYGVVSTGSVWQFLKLQGGTLFIDATEYHIREPGLILGILRHIIDTTVPPQPTASVAPSVTPAA
jgi:hypothetical protein